LSRSFQIEIGLWHLWISCWRRSIKPKLQCCVGNNIFSNAF